MHMAGQKTRRSLKTNKILEYITDMIFPPRCPVCDEILGMTDGMIHSGCKSCLYPVKEPVCLKCGKMITSPTREYCSDCAKKKNSHYDQGKAVFEYKGAVKQSIYRFKYDNSREYAGFYAASAVENYSGWIQRNKIDAIVPVPMYRKKKRKRGYNQAEVFARELSKKTGIPVENELVVRVENTPALKLLNYAERKNALDGAFQVRKNIVNCYKSILLVDDIYTTGSTAEEISRMLKQSGNIHVYLLCICIGKQD